MNRLENNDEPRYSDDAVARFHQTGWPIGDATFYDGAGGISGKSVA